MARMRALPTWVGLLGIGVAVCSSLEMQAAPKRDDISVASVAQTNARPHQSCRRRIQKRPMRFYDSAVIYWESKE